MWAQVRRCAALSSCCQVGDERIGVLLRNPSKYRSGPRAGCRAEFVHQQRKMYGASVNRGQGWLTGPPSQIPAHSAASSEALLASRPRPITSWTSAFPGEGATAGTLGRIGYRMAAGRAPTAASLTPLDPEQGRSCSSSCVSPATLYRHLPGGRSAVS